MATERATFHITLRGPGVFRRTERVEIEFDHYLFLSRRSMRRSLMRARAQNTQNQKIEAATIAASH